MGLRLRLGLRLEFRLGLKLRLSQVKSYKAQFMLTRTAENAFSLSVSVGWVGGDLESKANLNSSCS